MKAKRKVHRAGRRSARPSWRGRIPVTRIVEYGAVALLLVIVAYAGWFVVRVSAGVSAEVPAAERLIRLQVIDAGGNAQAADKLTRLVTDLSDDNAQVTLLERDTMDRHTIGDSFVISRERDLDPARWLADRLGLDDADVVFRPLENNHKQISVTLVLGEDCENIINTVTPAEEI